MAKETVPKGKELDNKIWEEIRKKVEATEYGTVVITVHDGRITQVEASTKMRF
jgi:hypothetical protein